MLRFQKQSNDYYICYISLKYPLTSPSVSPFTVESINISVLEVYSAFE